MTKTRAGYALLTGLTLMFAVQAAWACRHQAPRQATVPVEDIAILEIVATTGELRIHGEEGQSEIKVEGTACAFDADQLPNIQLSSQRIDDRLRIVAEVPYDSGQEGRVGYLHLNVSLPTNLAVELSDSSGDIEITDIASLSLTDSSGDIDLARVAGQVLILRDSSGDVEMRDVGPVIIQVDSSGDISVQRAESVVVEVDTSGDIELSDIRHDVSVGTDSSGAIRVSGVGGDFSVADDSSGGIRYRAVAGRVSIPPQRH